MFRWIPILTLRMMVLLVSCLVRTLYSPRALLVAMMLPGYPRVTLVLAFVMFLSVVVMVMLVIRGS